MLRSFILSDGDGCAVAPAQCADLNEYSQDRKIVIIGGHINLRNKIKGKFPKLAVFDGTSLVLDVTLLDLAEHVIFLTSHMSHKSYDRIVTYVKNHDIPFGFLRAVTNLEIFESELLALLHNG